MKFYYVYIIVSIEEPQRHYVGFTSNLKSRLNKHNTGQVTHTSKYKPWKYETIIAFRSEEKAIKFEKYLKSHSGRSFSSKHL